MKRALTFLVGVGIFAVLAAPAAAATTRVEYACDEYLVAVTNPGNAWVADGVLQLRGWNAVYDVVGDVYCEGTVTATANFNLDLASSTGALWGGATYDLDAYDGGFTATFTAHWTTENPLADDANDIWAGQYVGHGFGDLAGWQTRGVLVERFHWLAVENGFAFKPGS